MKFGILLARPDRLIVVTGTGTGVGKTWMMVETVRQFQAEGLSVAARKPAQSFAPHDTVTDASRLAAATGVAPEVVCPRHRWYPAALAPPMAADRLGLPPIAMDDLEAELHWPPSTNVGLVEGVGGLCSPMAHDGDTLALIERLRPDQVVLVADPALGVVSAVRLAAMALVNHPLLVILNRYDESNETHRRSRDWLVRVDSFRDRNMSGGSHETDIEGP